MVLLGEIHQLLAVKRLEGWVEGGCPVQSHGNISDQTVFWSF